MYGNETIDVSSFERARPMLLLIASKLIGRDLQAKLGASDLVQQTMLEAIQSAHTLRCREPRQIDRWLKALLVNNIKDAAKFFRDRLKRSVSREQRLILAGNLESHFCEPSEPSGNDEQIQQLHHALQTIPAAHRQVLIWRFLEQLSYVQIGKLTGRSEDSVRMMINRSLTRLKRELSTHDNTASG